MDRSHGIYVMGSKTAINFKHVCQVHVNAEVVHAFEIVCKISNRPKSFL